MNLTPDTIDIWRVDLAATPDATLRQGAILSTEENARASRFRRAEHRRRFVLARSALRQILAGYLNCLPGQISFLCNAAGKPEIDTPEQIAFNLSHSHERAVIAISVNRRLGVDIEHGGRQTRSRSVAHVFSPLERRQLAALSTPEYADGFLNTWVRKEAYVKAIGIGLQAELDSFAVDIQSPTAAPMLQNRPGDTTDWLVQPINAGLGYVGALVCDGGPAELVYRTWSAPADPVRRNSA